MDFYKITDRSTVIEPETPLDEDGNPLRPVAYLGTDYLVAMPGATIDPAGLEPVDATDDEVRGAIVRHIAETTGVSGLQGNELAAYKALTPEDQAKALVAKVTAFAEEIRMIASAHAGYLKVAGWNAKVDRATRIIGGVGTSDDLKIIGAEASIKGRTAEEQSDKIIEAAASFGELNGYVEGFESKLVEMVMAGQAEVVAGFVAAADETLHDQTHETIGEWVSQAVATLTETLGG